MQPCVVLMHGPSFGSSAAERNGRSAAEIPGNGAAGELTGAVWVSGDLGEWAQPATHSITIRLVTHARCRMA
jgi:hypothetical protein